MESALRLLVEVIGREDMDRIGEEWTDLYAAYWQARKALADEKERYDLIGRTVVVTADTPEIAAEAVVQSPQFGQHGEFPGRYLIRFSDGKHRMYYASEFTVVPRAGSFRRQQQDG
jgi:hypothetical protein